MTAASQQREPEVTPPAPKPRPDITAIGRAKMTAEQIRIAHEYAIEDMGVDG